MPGEESKLIIDTDWKAQAQAEKEKLAQTVKPAAKSSGGPAGPGNVTPEGADAPGTVFDELVRMLAMQALTFLGEIPDPSSGQRMFAPEYAKRFIDMVNMLEEKTKNNLSKDEDEALKAIAADLRMAYVEISKAVAKAVAEGKIKPQGGMGGSGGPMSSGPGIAGVQPLV